MAIGESAFPAERPDHELVRLKVNGTEHAVAVRPYAILLDVLRDQLGLTATKRGCDMGTCGCCAIHVDGEVRFACLELAARVQGKELTTLEGLAVGPELHPLQRAFNRCGASQCGFCTPGFLMTAAAFLRETPVPSEAGIREALSGNLCRCTGFVKIFEAVAEAASEMAGSCGGKAASDAPGACPGTARDPGPCPGGGDSHGP